MYGANDLNHTTKSTAKSYLTQTEQSSGRVTRLGVYIILCVMCVFVSVYRVYTCEREKEGERERRRRGGVGVRVGADRQTNRDRDIWYSFLNSVHLPPRSRSVLPLPRERIRARPVVS